VGTTYHEEPGSLDAKALDIKRAIDSMREELEAIDWYRQRMLASSNAELKALLDHHQREEIEHFVMLLEWCRRNDADFARELKAYLFSEGDLTLAEAEKEGGESEDRAPVLDRRRTVGSLREP
jgi:hypothetical protein